MSTQTPPSSGDTAQIAPTEQYSFDVDDVPGIDELRAQLRAIEEWDDAVWPVSNARVDSYVDAWSWLLQEYVTYGNTKVATNVAIFNMNSAHDCPNLGTEHCQVSQTEEGCYAVQSEKAFVNALPYRRRQEVLWDHVDAVTWAKAYRQHWERMNRPPAERPDAIRFSQSGDFRDDADIVKVDEIARRLDDIVDTYTYSASDYLDWSHAEHFVVNASNGLADYGDRRFIAVEDVSEIPDDPTEGLHCPYDATDGGIKCGECRLCIDADAPDVYVTIH